MLQKIDTIRQLLRDLDPLLVQPLTQGEVAWLTRLLVDHTTAFMEEVVKSHPSFVSLGDLEIELGRWHVKAYGPRPVRLMPTFQKLCEERQEFDEAFIEFTMNVPGAAERAAAEAADQIFVLFHLIRALGVSLPWAIVQKFNIIEQRLIDPSFGRGAKPIALPAAAKPDPAWYDTTPTPPIQVKEISSGQEGEADLSGRPAPAGKPADGPGVPEGVDQATHVSQAWEVG